MYVCKVFNEMNARSIDDSMNIFKGMFKNPLFIAIIIFTAVAQYGMYVCMYEISLAIPQSLCMYVCMYASPFFMHVRRKTFSMYWLPDDFNYANKTLS